MDPNIITCVFCTNFAFLRVKKIICISSLADFFYISIVKISQIPIIAFINLIHLFSNSPDNPSILFSFIFFYLESFMLELF